MCEGQEAGARMARQIRIEYAGATYHVMARGDDIRAIYGNEGVSPGERGNELTEVCVSGARKSPGRSVAFPRLAFLIRVANERIPGAKPLSERQPKFPWNGLVEATGPMR